MSEGRQRASKDRQATISGYAEPRETFEERVEISDFLTVEWLYGRSHPRTAYVVTVDPASCERCQSLPAGCSVHSGYRGGFFEGGLRDVRYPLDEEGPA